MDRLKKYSEQGTYFIEIQAPTKRAAEKIMRRLEKAIRALCVSRNRGSRITEWWFDSSDHPLARAEAEE